MSILIFVAGMFSYFPLSWIYNKLRFNYRQNTGTAIRLKKDPDSKMTIHGTKEMIARFKQQWIDDGWEQI